MSQIRYLPNPIFINIYLTNECNLCCKHCIDNSGTLTVEEKMNELTNKEIYYLIDYYIERGVKNISFSGGEPMLRKEIFAFIEYIKEKNFDVDVTIITNGTLINQEAVLTLENLGVNYIRISVESHEAEVHDWIRGNGNFNKTLETLKTLLKTSIPRIGVSMTVHRKNVGNIDNTIAFFSCLGLKHITLAPLMPAGRGEKLNDLVLSSNEFKGLLEKKIAYEEQYPHIYFTLDSPLLAILSADNKEKLEQFGPCIIGSCFIGFKSNGDVYACPMRDEVVIGNMRKDDLSDLWNNSKLLNEIRDLNNIKGKCKTCDLLSFCGGGCRAYTHIMHDDFCQPDPFCWR